ncbi:hypothetical protein [Microbulbifer taiwanensis]|uniref:hypothetical protein n=1 Tax=Microbulbifer taiwanensis TaxID=986746 RepID=UPI00362186BD
MRRRIVGLAKRLSGVVGEGVEVVELYPAEAAGLCFATDGVLLGEDARVAAGFALPGFASSLGRYPQPLVEIRASVPIATAKPVKRTIHTSRQ